MQTHRFQTTYEELKLYFVPESSSSPSLPDYLWGIETLQHSEGIWHSEGQASRLPMRNWNLCLPPLFLDPGFKLPDYLWGIETYSNLNRYTSTSFQTTYEELKLVFFFNASNLFSLLPDYLWGIETVSWASLPRSCRASRLPMRNWNTGSFFSVSFLIALPDYLWGIETSLIFPSSNNLLLPDYLWGIETFFACHIYISCPSLPDYLWGIETLYAKIW